MNQELVLEYSKKEDRKGKLDDFQGMSHIQEPGCGDIMEMYIRTRREIITEIRFTVTETACPPVKACAALAAEQALGKPVMEAYLINADSLDAFFGGLPRESYHCALMAEIALKKAIRDYATRRQLFSPLIVTGRESCRMKERG